VSEEVLSSLGRSSCFDPFRFRAGAVEVLALPIVRATVLGEDPTTTWRFEVEPGVDFDCCAIEALRWRVAAGFRVDVRGAVGILVYTFFCLFGSGSSTLMVGATTCFLFFDDPLYGVSGLSESATSAGSMLRKLASGVGVEHASYLCFLWLKKYEIVSSGDVLLGVAKVEVKSWSWELESCLLAGVLAGVFG